MSGFPAWMMWLGVHIFFLIGFRNPLQCLSPMAYTYLTLNDGVRLITGSQDLPGWSGADGQYDKHKAARPIDEAICSYKVMPSRQPQP